MKGNVDILVSNESPDHIILYISTNDVTLERNSEKDTILFLHFYKKLIFAKSEVGIFDVTPFFIQEPAYRKRSTSTSKNKIFLELQKSSLFEIISFFRKKICFS